NVVYLRWVQEVATAHWEYAAPEELKNAYTWVVIRHEIDYLASALPGDDIIGYTWVGEHQGAKFDRYVRLCRAGDDKILAEAKTTWCLLDSQTKRPRRIEENVLSIL
ncbi:MAG: acyl-ACP thioesterase, partial [Adhaeribacter sp.]|nr:acyl-ACP thioesterase [Adhaeribacter sp.]